MHLVCEADWAGVEQTCPKCGRETNQQIADELVVALGTVKWHVHNILQKLGVRNRTQATIGAQELGLL